MDFSDRQQYQYHYEQSHQETSAAYDPSQSQYDPYYAYHRQQQQHYYDYSSAQSYPPINLAPNPKGSSQIGPPGINHAAAAAAALSQLSEFAGTMDAAERAAMANGGPPPSMTHPYHHHHYTQHYSMEHGHVAIGPGDNGGRWGKRPFRGGGRRGRSPFRGGGGGGNFSHYPPNEDGEGHAPVRGRGGRGRIGRGGGRKQHPSAPDSQPTQTAPTAESLPPEGGKEQAMTQAPAAPVLPRPPLLPVAWCDICRVDCNSLQILEQHKSGKRHKRTVQRLEEIERQQKIFAELQAKVMPDTKLAGAAMEKHAAPENIASASVLSDQAGGANNASTTFGNNPVVVVCAAQPDVASKPYKPESNPDVISTAQQDSEAEVDKARTVEGQLAPTILGGAVEAPTSASLVAEECTDGSARLPPSSDGCNQSDRKHGGTKRRMTKFGRGGKRLKSSVPARDRAPERAKDRHRICTVCNVVCESLAAFESHLAGKKHASRIKRSQAEGTVYGPLTVYIPPNQPSAYPTKGQDPLFYGLRSQEMPQPEQYLNAEGGESKPHATKGLQRPEFEVAPSKEDKEVASMDTTRNQEAATASSDFESKEPGPLPLGPEKTSSNPEAASLVQEFGTHHGDGNATRV